LPLAVEHAISRQAMSDSTSPQISLWIWLLRAICVANLAAWGWNAWRLRAEAPRLPGDVARHRGQLLWLSALFVLGCAFRSILPRADVQRIALYGGWPSCVMLGRSVATIAEMAFMAQWALVLRAGSGDNRREVGWWVGRILVPMIAIAEVCSWYAVLTTNYMGNVCEQSIWTLSSVLVVVGLAQHRSGPWRPFGETVAAFIIPYILFMAVSDVPMYFRRWRADEARGRTYLSLADGVRDASFRVLVTRRWEPWHEEVAWMTLYFSSGVWISIWLVRGSPTAVTALSRNQQESHSKVAS
jgi:hypothetical protein